MSKSNGNGHVKATATRNRRKAAKRISAVAKAFRLSFNDIGVQKKLRPDETELALSDNVQVDERQVRFTKLLYNSQHPAIKAKNLAKSRMVTFFRKQTLPYPEQGVRLLVVKATSIDGQNKEIQAFLDSMNSLDAEFQESVSSLCRQWPSVLADCQEKLQDLFDPKNYPTAPSWIRARLEPYNLALPNYLKSVAPAEYAKQVKRLEDRFEQAVEMQEAYVAKLFHDSIEQMVASIKGFNDGKTRTFKKTVIARVQDSIDVFRENAKRHGIYSGSALEKELERMEKVIGGQDADELAKELRQAPELRRDFLKNVKSIQDQVVAMAEVRPRRSILRD